MKIRFEYKFRMLHFHIFNNNLQSKGIFKIPIFQHLRNFLLIVSLMILINITTFSYAYIWPKYGGTLRVPISSSSLILDPSRDMNYDELSIFFAIYDCLFSIDESGIVTPNLAKDFKAENFYKEYTIDINEKARFHDGYPVRASDVIAAFNRTFNILGNRMGDLSNITDIKPRGEKTIKFFLKESDADFPRKLAHPFCAVVKGDPITRSINSISVTYFIGTGAFKIKDVERRNAIRVERHAKYHRGKAYLDGVEFVLIPKADDSFIEYLSGKLDLHRVTYERYRAMQNRADIKVYERDGWDTVVFDAINRSLSKELIGSLDPQGLVQVTMNNSATEVCGIFPDDPRNHAPKPNQGQNKINNKVITLGYYGDRMFLEPIAQSIASKLESKGATVFVVELDGLGTSGCDAVLHIIKALGQDSSFMWKSVRGFYGFLSPMTPSDNLYTSAEEIEQKRAISEGRFYPIARLKMVFAIDDTINDFRLISNCVPDFWSINLN